MNIMGKQFTKPLLVLFVSMLMMLSMATTAFADEGDVPITLSLGDSAGTKQFFDLLKQKGKILEGGNTWSLHDKEGTKMVVLTVEQSSTSTPPKLTFNSVNYEKATAKEQKDFVSTFVTELNKTDISTNSKNTIYATMQTSSQVLAPHMMTAILDEVSASKQMGKTMQIVSPFLPALSILVGVLAIIVIFTLVLSTAADLSYITLPVFRNRVANNAEQKGTKISFISHDAQSVVRDTEIGSGGGDGGYTNPVILYMKRRIITYIAIGVCLLYLVFGGMSALITSLLNIVQGFGMN